ncbi:SSI family serine proteinase inhibitor [Streptomyces sp. NPDC086549]|uniref:SSI family serine proteinase inhibitor n=1 Tax=Streptomyces sp. NPDC086549 TaxID=3365752 RepID=UPI003812F7A3
MTYRTSIEATVVRGALLAAAALLTAATAAPAQAAPRDALPDTWLFLTVTRDDSVGDTRGTLLLCDPPRGHAHAAEACAELEAADGDIQSTSPKEGAVCPMVYAPVTARALGKWHGRPVLYKETFSNACAMTARAGAVFALDG